MRKFGFPGNLGLRSLFFFFFLFNFCLVIPLNLQFCPFWYMHAFSLACTEAGWSYGTIGKQCQLSACDLGTITGSWVLAYPSAIDPLVLPADCELCLPPGLPHPCAEVLFPVGFYLWHKIAYIFSLELFFFTLVIVCGIIYLFKLFLENWILRTSFKMKVETIVSDSCDCRRTSTFQTLW